MINGMQDALRGCIKEEMRMDIISNNIANVNVIGFKKTKIAFQDVLNEAKAQGDDINTNQVGVRVDLSQGDSRVTGNPLDFAINGEGFFKVETSEGVRYTRKGNFTLDPTRFLITQDGDRVLGAGGPIFIPEGDVFVDGYGNIKAGDEEAGKIDVVYFKNTDRFILEGKGLYKNDSDESEGAPPAETRVQQGYVELSNVNIAEEMIQMIHSLRAFETYQKSIQVLDSINNRVINDVSRLR